MIGSLTNYNLSKYSDIDLHIVLNYSQFPENTKELYVEFFDLNSNQFGYTFYLVLLDTLTYDSLVWTTDGNSSLISQSGDTAYFVLDFTGVTFTVTLTLYKDGCARSAVTDLAIVRIKELFQNGKISRHPIF